MSSLFDIFPTSFIGKTVFWGFALLIVVLTVLYFAQNSMLYMPGSISLEVAVGELKRESEGNPNGWRNPSER